MYQNEDLWNWISKQNARVHYGPLDFGLAQDTWVHYELDEGEAWRTL